MGILRQRYAYIINNMRFSSINKQRVYLETILQIGFILQMELITKPYKRNNCYPDLKLGLTPLYIGILFFSFASLVYGNCVIKVLQKTRDAEISVGK